MSPKFVRDGKKYGRRSRPTDSNQGAATPLDFPDELSDIEMDDYSIDSPLPTPVAGMLQLLSTNLLSFLLLNVQLRCIHQST